MTSKDSERLANAIGDLASAVKANTGEMKALRDAVDDLRFEYAHAIRESECPYLAEAANAERNRSPFLQEDTLDAELTPDEIQQAIADEVTAVTGLPCIVRNADGNDTPASIACDICDVESPDSLADALREGWTDLRRDDGPSWDYLGLCPACQAEENALPTEEPHSAADSQKQLFA